MDLLHSYGKKLSKVSTQHSLLAFLVKRGAFVKIQDILLSFCAYNYTHIRQSNNSKAWKRKAAIFSMPGNKDVHPLCTATCSVMPEYEIQLYRLCKQSHITTRK